MSSGSPIKSNYQQSLNVIVIITHRTTPGGFRISSLSRTFFSRRWGRDLAFYSVCFHARSRCDRDADPVTRVHIFVAARPCDARQLFAPSLPSRFREPSTRRPARRRPRFSRQFCPKTAPSIAVRFRLASAIVASSWNAVGPNEPDGDRLRPSR